MRGRTKMMLAQAAARRGRGNDYGNPRDNEKPNNNYNNSGYNNAGGEMRDRPYYGGRYEQSPGPVNVIVEPMPMRYEGGNMGGGGGMGMNMNMPENNRYGGYNEGNRYGGYNNYNGGGMEYRGGEMERRGGGYNASNAYGASNQYPPPMYEEYGGGRQIGFGGNSETKGDRSEMNSRNIQFYGSKHNKSSSKELTKEKAQEWTKKMKNSDGSSGPHWKMEQTNALMEKLGVSLNPIEFYVAANMMYSDYCAVAKKFGLDTPDFYGHMAKAFLEDKDAGSDKLKKYFEEVVGEEEDDD